MNELGLYIKETRNKKGFSKRALAEAANISHTEVHRIENGQRQNPSPPVLKSIAKALGVQYEELMEKAGYINNPNEIIPLRKQREKEEKFIEILTPKLIKDGWSVEQCSPSSIADLLAKKSAVKWNFEFKYFDESNRANLLNKDIIFNTYGKLAVYDGKQITKFTIVTNNRDAYDTYIKYAPINLKIQTSVMLVDFDANKIVEETALN